MSEHNDGGPAFPTPPHKASKPGSHGFYATVIDGGMTLRDYFAAKAMQGLIASNDEGAGDRIGEIPAYAYMIADAMLAERDKPS